MMNMLEPTIVTVIVAECLLRDMWNGSQVMIAHMRSGSLEGIPEISIGNPTGTGPNAVNNSKIGLMALSHATMPHGIT